MKQNPNSKTFDLAVETPGWEAVIGIELHVQLNTATKLFCGCANRFGSQANENTCPVCLGHPGVLPVLNEEVLKKAAKIALAVSAEVNPVSIFERKNYYYPDLPKAYQISQLFQPVCTGGALEVFVADSNSGYTKTVELERVQIEEDAGKLIHPESGRGEESFVDLNRSSTPLVEIVSKPQMSSAKEAVAYFRTWRELLLYLDVSKGNMQEGNMRCDVNVSLRPVGSSQLGTRTETKNMNTFKGIEAAVSYEIKRQYRLLSQGKSIEQQTLLFDPVLKETKPMRSKEEAQDYRYFPDPDLRPATISASTLAELKANIGELPAEKKNRFASQYGLSAYDAWLLASQKAMADYFEQAHKAAVASMQLNDKEKGIREKAVAKKTCNWISTEVLSVLSERNITISEFEVDAVNLGELVAMIESGEISGKIAKQVFPEMIKGKRASKVVQEKGLALLSDVSQLEALAEKVIAENGKAAADFRAGNQKTFGFLVGQAMKISAGKADPAKINTILRKKLSENNI